MTDDSAEALVVARRKTHGDFGEVAHLYLELMAALRLKEGYRKLSDVQVMGLEMIMHKTARIISGNPNEMDHWKDIAGYATVVMTKMTKMTKEVP